MTQYVIRDAQERLGEGKVITIQVRKSITPAPLRSGRVVRRVFPGL